MAQFARPDADQAVGGWTATPLWSKVDEGATGDGTEITSGNNTSPDNADLRLSDVTDPAVSTGHVLRAEWHKSASGGHSINAVLELWQGVPGTGSLVATLSVTAIGNTPQTDTYTLSGTETDNITNYSDLYLRVSRQGDTGGNPGTRRSLVVDYIELETPDAAPVTVTLAGLSASVSTATGNVVEILSLAGPTVAVSSSSGIASIQRTLAGISGAVSTAAGNLTVEAAAVLLAGISAAQSAASGAIVATFSLVGQSTALSTASGVLSPLRALAGSAIAQGAAAGNVVVQLALQGASAATSTASGVLSTGGLVLLAGVSVAQSAATGAINALRGLSGISAAQSASAGVLTVAGTILLAGISAAQSVVSGVLTKLGLIRFIAEEDSHEQAYFAITEIRANSTTVNSELAYQAIGTVE